MSKYKPTLSRYSHAYKLRFKASGGVSAEIYITLFHDTRFVLQSLSFVQLDGIL
jgi:hypothetical protein